MRPDGRPVGGWLQRPAPDHCRARMTAHPNLPPRAWDERGTGGGTTLRGERAWLAAHPRVTVLWLPRYAAHDANPAERIWGLMKADVAANRLAGTIADLTYAARRFFAHLAPHPVPSSFLEAT
jgi:hypothetical protein